MRASNAPPLVLIALGLLIIALSSRPIPPPLPSKHEPFAPAERIDLAAFMLTTLSSPLPTARPPPDQPAIEATWLRADTPQERILSLPRAALHATALSRLRVFPHLRTLFCPVPGVASRALITALLRAERAAGGATAPPLTAYAPRDRERILARSDMLRVLFVRHPLARALSAFYRGRSVGDVDHPKYRAFMGRVRGRKLGDDEHELQPVSLLFFLTFLGAQQIEDLWEPFRPVTDLCALGLFEYNFVGRLEQLDDHVQALEKRLGARLRPLERPSFRSNASSTVRDMFASRQRRAKADKLYGTDIEILGYKNM